MIAAALTLLAALLAPAAQPSPASPRTGEPETARRTEREDSLPGLFADPAPSELAGAPAGSSGNRSRELSSEAPREQSLEALLADPDARVMWVGAHPDDETLAGPILARACIGLGRPCLLFVLTHGEGGRCPFATGCHPDLAAVRHRELARVAHAYNAELEHHRFWNAPLPESSFPPRAAIARRWRESRDPGALVARAIRRFRPTVVLSFDPQHGFTGHPEHQLASRFAMEGVRRAADPQERLELPAHRVPALYQVLNRYWMMRLAGAADPTEPTEEFDTHVGCGPPRRACLDVALEITKYHATQVRDMGNVRKLRPQIGLLYLRRVDPLSEVVPSPYED